ncbi:hypothetical protein [uncultured Hymenobacter sp.]|uniref:hypothetical protein n=1 Tax=uncultured Hymenobacter sp. TaxID=170016 RepID=UPI0035CC66B8
MRSWINSSANSEAGPQPKPDSLPENAATAAKPRDERVALSGSGVVEQILEGLGQVQAALTSGRELLQVELDLLEQELAHPKPAKGILHKAVEIIRHKVTEKGEIVLGNAGWTQLARVDELIERLPEDGNEGE